MSPQQGCYLWYAEEPTWLYFSLAVFTETCKMYLPFKLGTRTGCTSFPEGVETKGPLFLHSVVLIIHSKSYLCENTQHVWLSLPKYISCHISLSELLKKIWVNSWRCPSFFSAFIFAHFLTWLQNHLHQTILQVILLFNIRAADSANHSAFQCLGTLILQIILLFNVRADWFCKSFCTSTFEQIILQVIPPKWPANNSAFPYLGRWFYKFIPQFKTRADLKSFVKE